MSINVGPSKDGSHQCDLNNVTDDKQFAVGLNKTPGFTYNGVEVRAVIVTQFLLVLHLVLTFFSQISPINGATSRFAHLEKLNLNVSSYWLHGKRSRKKGFSAFWPRVIINWSESKESTKQRLVGRERKRLPGNPLIFEKTRSPTNGAPY